MNDPEAQERRRAYHRTLAQQDRQRKKVKSALHGRDKKTFMLVCFMALAVVVLVVAAFSSLACSALSPGQKTIDSPEAQSQQGGIVNLQEHSESVNDPEVIQSWVAWSTLKDMSGYLFLAFWVWHFSYRREKPRYLRANGVNR